MRDHSALCPSYINVDIGFTSYCLLTAASFYKNNNLLILSSCFVVSLLFFDVKSTLDVFYGPSLNKHEYSEKYFKILRFYFCVFFPNFSGNVYGKIKIMTLFEFIFF